MSLIDYIKTSTSTPTPTLEPTATSIETPAQKLYDINWIVGDYIPEKDENAARCGAALIHDYAASLGMSPLEQDVTFYFLTSDDMLNILGMDPGSRYAKDLESTQGGYFMPLNSVFINFSSYGYRNKINGLVTSIHELSHFQRNMSSNIDGYPQGSGWIDQAISEFHDTRVMTNANLGHSPYSWYRSFIADNVSKSSYSYSSRDLENRAIYEFHSPFSFLVGEFLASQAGEKALYDFYAALGPETTWESEFNNVFGVSVDEFYGLLDKHIEAGFPELGFSE